MSNSKTLADALGLETPQEPAVKNEKVTAKSLSKAILSSQEYRDSLRRRIMADTLPPAVECRLYDYAFGKPVDKVEIKDTSDPLSDMTLPQLQARARKLLQLTQSIAGDPVPQPEAIDGEIVH